MGRAVRGLALPIDENSQRDDAEEKIGLEDQSETSRAHPSQLLVQEKTQ